MSSTRRIATCLGLAAALLSAPVAAQTGPTRIRGTIEKVTGQDVEIKAREGGALTLRLADNARIVAIARATMADIKPGTYVGIAALPRPDGSQMALEVLIFPEAMRGAGEGHRPWDLMPESTMTNATVSDTVAKTEGQTLTLSYKEGSKAIVVPPEAPIVTFVPAERADLKPGTRIFTAATRAGQDGPWSAASITVGKDGVDPPM